RLLETGKEKAVLFALPRRSYTDLVMTFPLINAEGKYATDWFKQSSFLVFLHNLLYTLGHVSDAAAERNLPPGEVMVLRPDGAVEEVTVTDPAGGRKGVKRGAGREFVYRDTERVGVYRAAWPGGGRRFAVNLLDESESNVQPRDDLKLGSQRVEAGASRRQ